MKKLSWHNKQGFLYFYVRAAILNRGVLLSANIYYIIERKSCLVVQYLSSEWFQKTHPTLWIYTLQWKYEGEQEHERGSSKECHN